VKRFTLFVLMFLLGACTGPAGKVRGGVVELVAADHDRQVDVNVGQTVTVRLDANRTTGYTWLLPAGRSLMGSFSLSTRNRATTRRSMAFTRWAWVQLKCGSSRPSAWAKAF